MNRTERAGVVVVGGGVIGASTAYHLAREKVDVILLEKNELASGSSGACDGLVFLQSKKPGIHLELALASKKRFEILAGLLPVDIEYRNKGGLVVIESEAEWEAMEQFAARQQQNGLDVSLLEAKQARELESQLAEDIVGAAYSPLDGQVNPIALAQGLALGARDLGAKIITGVEVKNIVLKNGRVKAVETGRFRVETEAVILAAGVHTPRIGRTLGLDLPIIPRRGQILVTEKMPPMLKHVIISAKYLAAKFNPELAVNGGGLSMEQTDHGNFLLGSTREFAGFDRRTTIDGLRQVAAKTARLVPGLKNMNIIRSFAGLRPYTPDGLPILGPVPGASGLFLAAGHEGDGIALSPITGYLMAQLAIAGRADFSLTEFSLERFQTLKGERADEPAVAH